MLLTTLAAVHAAQAMVATEPRSVLNEMQAAGAAVDATGFRAPRAACLEATEWEAPPEGIEREQWESIDGRERLAVKLARSWAGVDDYETPEARRTRSDPYIGTSTSSVARDACGHGAGAARPAAEGQAPGHGRRIVCR